MPTPFVSAAQKAQILGDALPYIQGFHYKTIVIKYGGHAMTEPALKTGFARDIALLQLVGMRPVVVHGGGPRISEMLDKVGVTSVFRGGMRVTDERAMNIVEMVLAELNQEIVGLINQHGGKAVGLNGQDGRFISAVRLRLPAQDGGAVEQDLGFVGDVERIDPELIDLLHSGGFMPVIMPIGVGPAGEAYDINADLVAGRIAEALAAEKLIMMTSVPGVLDRHGKLIPGLTAAEFEALHADGTVADGILPRVDSALHAVRHGVKSAHIIDGRVPHALLLELLTTAGVGTLLLPDSGPHFLADSRRYLTAPAAM